VKPAGQNADKKSVACMVVLKELAPSGFSGIGGTWVACLLQKGRLFRRKADGTIFLSLGFNTKAVIAWAVVAVAPGFFQLAPAKMTADDCAARMSFLVTSNLGPKGLEDEEDFVAILSEPCSALNSFEAQFCVTRCVVRAQI
jgi:hypothetical protein